MLVRVYLEEGCLPRFGEIVSCTESLGRNKLFLTRPLTSSLHVYIGRRMLRLLRFDQLSLARTPRAVSRLFQQLNCWSSSTMAASYPSRPYFVLPPLSKELALLLHWSSLTLSLIALVSHGLIPVFIFWRIWREKCIERTSKWKLLADDTSFGPRHWNPPTPAMNGFLHQGENWSARGHAPRQFPSVYEERIELGGITSTCTSP